MSGGALMVVEVTVDDMPGLLAPGRLVSGPYADSFDVRSIGQRFLLIRE